MRRKMKEKGFWEGAQAAMPTALGYVSIGLACAPSQNPFSFIFLLIFSPIESVRHHSHSTDYYNIFKEEKKV